MSVHVNQEKKAAHISWVFYLCVSYCVDKKKRGSGVLRIWWNFFPMIFYFILIFQGLLGPPGTTGDRGPVGEPVSWSPCLLQSFSMYYTTPWRLKLHFTKIQYCQLWLGRNCGVIVPKLQNWSLPPFVRWPVNLVGKLCSKGCTP